MTLKQGKRTGIKYFSYQDIQSWKPCYNANKFIPETWRGTAVDILKLDKVPVADRLWVVLRSEISSERVMRLFAVWCARQVQHLMTDKRSLDALDVAERFARGEATQEELAAARDAAWAAAWTAAGAAAGAAAWTAAWTAARDAAWAAARAAQVTKLIEMLEAEGRERVVAKSARNRTKVASGSCVIPEGEKDG